ncbi:MAG: hypothetical protein LC733_04285 [Actinobacteria bacterium]|nr:hypothetical protein [Actinomycetota bacterium]
MARVRPAGSGDLDALLAMPLGLDVWERGPDTLLVAATDAQLSELERRRLAHVERLSTVADYLAGWRPAAGDETERDDPGRRQ